MRTELNSVVRFSVDLMGQFHLILFQFGLRPESWRELGLSTNILLYYGYKMLMFMEEKLTKQYIVYFYEF